MRWSKRCTIAPGTSAEPLIHHSDRGVQYLSIRYTERLAQAGIEPSVGSAGDSYDSALAESIIGLYKADEIRRRGPWMGVEEVEFATLEGGRLVQHAACSSRSGMLPQTSSSEPITDTRRLQLSW